MKNLIMFNMICLTAKENFLLTEKLYRHSEYNTDYEDILEQFRDNNNFILDYNTEILNNSVIYHFIGYKQNFGLISKKLDEKIRLFIVTELLNICAMNNYILTENKKIDIDKMT